jgi:very-short-patch-repair endonuclease
MARRIDPPSEHMLARARQLREQTTTPERLLWNKLRNGRCAGFKFRRQEPVGPYVTDFFCASARLVVELDGRSHDEREVRDQERQSYLERKDLMVVRISNDRVISDLDGVAQAIADVCEERLLSLRLRGSEPSPGPEGPPSP